MISLPLMFMFLHDVVQNMFSLEIYYSSRKFFVQCTNHVFARNILFLEESFCNKLDATTSIQQGQKNNSATNFSCASWYIGNRDTAHTNSKNSVIQIRFSVNTPRALKKITITSYRSGAGE